MIRTKTKNILPEFITHGVKTVGLYMYILKIDMTGQTIIVRVKTDNTEILYSKKLDATTIANFWSDPTGHTYTYFYKL